MACMKEAMDSGSCARPRLKPKCIHPSIHPSIRGLRRPLAGWVNPSPLPWATLFGGLFFLSTSQKPLFDTPETPSTTA